jgi:hypothetical protein
VADQFAGPTVAAGRALWLRVRTVVVVLEACLGPCYKLRLQYRWLSGSMSPSVHDCRDERAAAVDADD